jgi:predicted site-specific integrase-resolvase
MECMMNENQKTNLLTYGVVATRLGISEISVKRMAAAGIIPVIRFSHRLVRVPESALESTLAAMTSGGPDPLPEKAV